MKIIIKSSNIDLTPSIKQYVEEKIGGLEKHVANFDPALVGAEVEVGRTTRHHRQGDIFRAEVNLSIGGKLLRVEKEEESLQAAIDLAKDELGREIRNYKDKQATQFVRGARSWKKFWRISSLARFRRSKVKNILKKHVKE